MENREQFHLSGVDKIVPTKTLFDTQYVKLNLEIQFLVDHNYISGRIYFTDIKDGTK